MPCEGCGDGCGRSTIDQPSTPVFVCGSAVQSNGNDVETLQLCDIIVGGGGIGVNSFLRHIVYDPAGVVIQVFDTNMDGVTPYVMVGFAQNCDQDVQDTELLVLCDDDGPFVRLSRYSQFGDMVQNQDYTIDLGATYSPVGTVHICGSTAPAVPVDTPEYVFDRTTLAANTLPAPYNVGIPSDTREIMIYNITASDIQITHNLGNVVVPANGTIIMSEPRSLDISQDIFAGEVIVTPFDDVGPQVNGVDPRVIINFKRWA